MATMAVPKNMKAYTVGLLYPGPAYEALSDKTIPENAALQAAHLDGVRRCIEQGVQIMAVPMITPGSKVSAMAVYRQDVTAEEAAALLAEDPAIKAGRFSFEVQVALFPSLDCIEVEY